MGNVQKSFTTMGLGVILTNVTEAVIAAEKAVMDQLSEEITSKVASIEEKTADQTCEGCGEPAADGSLLCERCQAMKEVEEAKRIADLEKERIRLYEANIDAIIALFPTHSRTSCSDENQANLGRCNRCSLLHFKNNGWDDTYKLNMTLTQEF